MEEIEIPQGAATFEKFTRDLAFCKTSDKKALFFRHKCGKDFNHLDFPYEIYNFTLRSFAIGFTDSHYHFFDSSGKEIVSSEKIGHDLSRRIFYYRRKKGNKSKVSF